MLEAQVTRHRYDVLKLSEDKPLVTSRKLAMCWVQTGESLAESCRNCKHLNLMMVPTLLPMLINGHLGGENRHA